MSPSPKPPLIAVIATALLGLTAIAGGASAIVHDLTREPTEAEKRAAADAEAADRWRMRTASEIFPARVDQRTDGISRGEVIYTALRVGIASPASCGAAFDARVAAVLAKYGCRTTLRATYVDGSRTLASTLGVAVLPDAARATKAGGELSTMLGFRGAKGREGLRTVPFAGTVAAAYTDSLRQEFWFNADNSPYVFFSSSGWLTGRGTPEKGRVVESFHFARYGLQQVERLFGANGPACERRGVRC
ncbi:hypothetical protein [Spirillospora sp. NPDC029432]|uniref:hypothetical protein n=1 Tax=Spirillospora sp. NPDC029432 TaxID=3154599 RepID=UPI0034545B37